MFCPGCGFNITADKPVDIGRWQLQPHEVRFDGKPLKLTQSETLFLHTLASARGRPVKYEIMAERISEAPNALCVVRVHACHLRKKLPAVPFKTVWGVGFQWSDD